MCCITPCSSSVIYLSLFQFSERLDKTTNKLVNAALKDSTLKTYSSAQRKFISFCEEHNLTSVPASNETLSLFISNLHEQGFKGSSIHVYLSGIRNLHITKDHVPPVLSPKLKLQLKGANNLSAPTIRKLPITFDLLCKMIHKLKDMPDELVLKTVMATAFFGCFRAGELCVTGSGGFNSELHLSQSDVTIDYYNHAIVIKLKSSKTDKERKGVLVNVGCSQVDICAHCFMIQMLTNVKPSSEVPLFSVCGGSPLTREYFCSIIRLLLTMLNIDPTHYSGHSFRAGAATSAGNVELSSWELKKLGRWSSDCYNIYLRNPKVVNSFATKLAKDN